MSNKPKFLVKFCKYNSYTWQSITDRTIYFRTVYDFNDFNEFPDPLFTGDEKLPEILEKIHGNLLEISDIRQFLEDIDNDPFLDHKKKIDVVNFLKEHGFFRKNSEPKKNSSTNHLIYRDKLAIILRHILSRKTGIFCMSDISVFEEDNAQIMFAHYAENLTGLALIYQALNNQENRQDSPVRYVKKRCIHWTKKCFSGKENGIEPKDYAKISKFEHPIWIIDHNMKESMKNDKFVIFENEWKTITYSMITEDEKYNNISEDVKSPNEQKYICHLFSEKKGAKNNALTNNRSYNLYCENEKIYAAISHDHENKEIPDLCLTDILLECNCTPLFPINFAC